MRRLQVVILVVYEIFYISKEDGRYVTVFFLTLFWVTHIPFIKKKERNVFCAKKILFTRCIKCNAKNN